MRTAYEGCIEDILNHCFVYDYFIFPQSKRLMHLIEEKYHVLPDHPLLMVIHLYLEIMISGLDLLCIQIILSFVINKEK